MSSDVDPTIRTIGRGDEIPSELVVAYYLEDLKLRVSVARVDGQLYAFEDLCPCAVPPCPLSGGLLTGTTLMCQCHGSQFDIATGAVLAGPSGSPLRTHEVEEVGGDVRLGVSQAANGGRARRAVTH